MESYNDFPLFHKKLDSLLICKKQTIDNRESSIVNSFPGELSTINDLY